MTILLVLIPVALGLGGLGLAGFLWAMRTRQYEDLDGAAWRALSDDDLPGGGGLPPEAAESPQAAKFPQATTSPGETATRG